MCNCLSFSKDVSCVGMCDSLLSVFVLIELHCTLRGDLNRIKRFFGWLQRERVMQSDMGCGGRAASTTAQLSPLGIHTHVLSLRSYQAWSV